MQEGSQLLLLVIFVYLNLLFSGFKMGAERSVQTGHMGYALVNLVGKFSFVAIDWKGLDEHQWLLWIEEEDAVITRYFSSKSGKFALFELHPCLMDWHDGRNEMGMRLPFFSGSQIIERVVSEAASKLPMFLFLSFYCHRHFFLLSSEPSGK